MKKFIILFFLLSFNSVLFSQFLFRSNHLIEPYFGFPNLGVFSTKLLSDSVNKSNEEYSGIAPSGLRYSFMINEDVSVGIDVIYNQLKESYISSESLFENNDLSTVNNSIIKSSQRLRIQARIDFHFPVSFDRADSYLGIGFGTNNKWEKTIKNGEVIEKLSGDEAVLFPFSLRFCYGFRYFFNYNFGMNGEVGFGGPLLSIGLTCKI